jgi:hypothetical protein
VIYCLSLVNTTTARAGGDPSQAVSNPEIPNNDRYAQTIWCIIVPLVTIGLIESWSTEGFALDEHLIS